MKNRKMSRRRFSVLSAAAISTLSLDRVKPSWARAPKQQLNSIQLINPLIGASTSKKLGEGKTFPGATTPFGLVQLSPDTITGGDNAPGYSYEHTTVEGFSFLHMSGVGWYGDLGNLQVMPSSGPMKLACGRIEHPGEGWRSRFNHQTETATANYYAVKLDDYGIRAEMTAAPRSGMLRFTFPEAKDSRIQIDLARRIAGTSTRQYVKVAGKNAIEGWMKCPPSGGGWGNGNGRADYTIYFRLELSKPLEKFGVWSIAVSDDDYAHHKLVSDYFHTDEYYAKVDKGKVEPGCMEREGNHLGFFSEFATKSGEHVLVKAGISLVSIEGARKNLASDIPGWDFDATVDRGRSLWAKELERISVEGGTSTQNVIFSTAMYHAMIDPRVASDVDGNYTAADKTVRKANGYTRRTIFSGWDVFRAEFPLMTIINPELVNDEINSLVELAAESRRGYLERWEIVNAYSGCMDGDPATSVIVDAYKKGIRGFDVKKAYAACHQTASGMGSETNRPNNSFYLEHGYVPNQVSWTLDNAYYDWCVATFAAALGKTSDAKLFYERAKNYRKIYDPTVQCMHAKDAAGNWTEWKGKTTFGQGCTESNPGQQNWFVPHDIQGLIDLMGKENFAADLEELFEKTPLSFNWNQYYNHADEPVHHVPYLFVYVGKPWLTQKWVSRILSGAYHNDVNGICGNDDVGQMSAWYVLSSIGFYPVCPGDNVYILGSPAFSRATIKLDPRFHKGTTFSVIANDSKPDNCYIRDAKLNGKELTRAWITHEEVTAGGILELTMSSSPNKEWGIADEDLPPSMSRNR